MSNDEFPLLRSARHKSNANYENLVYDYADKRVANNLLCDSCLTLEFLLRYKIFLTQLEGQTRVA